jgi:hypothetical protein
LLTIITASIFNAYLPFATLAVDVTGTLVFSLALFPCVSEDLALSQVVRI